MEERYKRNKEKTESSSSILRQQKSKFEEVALGFGAVEVESDTGNSSR
jgi:hypothetical protein